MIGNKAVLVGLIATVGLALSNDAQAQGLQAELPGPPRVGKWIHVQGTVAQRRQRGPAVKKARFISSRNAYRQFFSPQGQWSVDRPVFWTGGERVVAFATGEGQGTPTIMTLKQIGSVLYARVAYSDQQLNAFHNSRPFHAVKIKASDLTGKVDRVEVLPFFLEPQDPGTGAGPAAGGETQPEPKPQATERRIPIRGTIAQRRFKGPATRRAGIASRPAEYRSLFHPQGEWAVDAPVFWTGGERAVLVSAGEDNVELNVVALRQKGSTLTATIEKTELPKHVRARAFHAVKIHARDLAGPVKRVKVEVKSFERLGKEIPIRGTVAKRRYKGPATRRAGIASRPAEYKSLFSPQGEWAVDAPVFWTGGERAVLVSAGEGNVELEVVKLRQEGSTLIAIIDKQELPKHVMARAYHAVKFSAADLDGTITHVKVRVARTLKTHQGDERGGLRGAVDDLK